MAATLEVMIPANNPYLVGAPVFLDGEFFDRTEELATIRRQAQIDGPSSVLVRGPRRIGKSSVLLRAGQLLRAQGHPTVYIDLHDLDVQYPKADTEELVRAALARIAARIVAPDGAALSVQWPDRHDTVDGFRDSVLKAVSDAHPRSRLVILLDEMDVLMRRDEDAAARIVSAFDPGVYVRGARRPFAVIAEGRTWSQSAGGQRLRSLLRTAQICELGLFSQSVVRQVMTEPVERHYSFGPSALEQVWQQTEGFPLLVSAIGHALFENQQAQTVPVSTVGVDDIQAALAPALMAARTSLTHARDMIVMEEQLLLRAMAEISFRSARPDRYVALDEMADLVDREGHYRFASEPQAGLLQNLIENFIVQPNVDGSAFRITAPMFEHWVREDTFSAIQLRASTSNAEAGERYKRGLALVDRGQVAEAAAEFRVAITLNENYWQAELQLASLLAARDEFDEGLAIARKLARNHHGNREVERALGRLLTQKAVSADRAGDRVESRRALEEIQAFDPMLWRFPDAEQLLLRFRLADWQQTLERTDVSEWREATSTLSKEIAGRAWLKGALDFYCDRLRRATPGNRSLAFALGLIRGVFPIIASLATDTIPVASEIGQVPDADAKARTDGADLAAAWLLTVTLLGRAIERPWDPPGERVPARLFEELLYLPMTDQVRDEIERLVDMWLPGRFGVTVADDPEDAPALVRLMARRPTRLATIRKALDDIAVEHSSTPAASERFLRIMPSVYSVLLDADRQLPQRDRQSHVEQYSNQIEMAIESLAPAPLKALDIPKEWHQLISQLSPGGAALAQLVAILEQHPVASRPDLTEDAPRPTPELPEKTSVQSVLGNDYHLGDSLSRRIPGLPPDAIRQYLAVRIAPGGADERVMVRVYSTRGYAEESKALLHWMWNLEYRALYALSTRWEGRALPRLLFAHVDSEGQQYVLVSEQVGPRSLREEIDEGRLVALTEAGRGELWRHLHAIAEAVAGLHRLRYIHRAIRPENILLAAEAGRSRVRYRLTNFEWAVYLNALARYLPRAERSLTYHLPPESLSLEFNATDGSIKGGEGFGVDAYGLGLVFFECLVRRLRPDERRPLDVYDMKRHCEWLEFLRYEIHQARENGNLSIAEAGLIQRMLDPDPQRREDDLDRVADETRRLALLSSGLAQRLNNRPLTVYTPLELSEASCIQNFLAAHIALPDDVRNDSRALAKFVEDELKGARVFLSSSPEEHPLLLQGHRIAFTVKPFVYNERKDRRLAYLEVAKKGISADGDWIAKVSTIRVRAISAHIRTADDLTGGEWWEELFDIADERLDGLAVDERQLLRQLGVTVDITLRVWEKSILPVMVHETGVALRSAEQFVLIGAADGSKEQMAALRDAVEENVDRQISEFDLSRSRSALASFQREAQWSFAGIEADGQHIRLVRKVRRLTPEPPAQGQIRYLRPWSLSPSRVQLLRHRESLRLLEGDSYLLRALASPAKVTHAISPRTTEFFDKRLDGNKQELVERIRNVRPLFLVQGPPGTGKTTLAREVVLQLLAEEPGARILVTSQGHEPLNNLLDKTEQAIAEELKRSNPRLLRPLSVRLLAPEKQYGDTATQINRRYFPAEVGRNILEQATQWSPSRDEISDPEVLRDWQIFLAEHRDTGLSAALEERLIDGANIVYATLNDRHLTRFREDAFDLVIVEEAARAYPIELVGPLRLARRWLLIGDQQQLPPFGIDDFRKELVSFVDEIDKNHGHIPLRRREDVRGPPYLGYADAGELREKLEDTTALFQTLYRRGDRLERPASQRLLNQWRMHPDIADMVSKVFYAGELKTADREFLASQRRHRLRAPVELHGKALVWLDVPPVDVDGDARDEPAAGGGFTNGYEIRALQGFLKSLEGNRMDAAILSPYRAQVRLMQQKFFDTWHHPVTGSLADRIFTIDSFQGRQASLVGVSLVRNNDNARETGALGFVTNKARATVMFSRAERLLVVVGCSAHFKRFRRSSSDQGYVIETFNYIERHGEVLQAYNYLRPEDIAALADYHSRRS